VFESDRELDVLQRLLDESFEKAGERLIAAWGKENRLSARQLAGFRGVKLVAVASVNLRGEPRVAPRSAAFLHGKFYLAANAKSVLVRRLKVDPAVAMTYFENHLLVMAHGTTVLIQKGDSGFREVASEWVKAFDGGRGSLQGIEVLLRVEATHLQAFALHPEQYPEEWGRASLASRT